MNLDNLTLSLTALSVGISTCSLFYVVILSNNSIPEDDREFKDPLPLFLRLIWPLVRTVAYFFCSNLPYSYLKKLEDRLRKTGVSYLLIAEEFIALRIIISILVLLTGIVAMTITDYKNSIMYMILPLLGFIYPDIWLHDVRKRRFTSVLKTLPVYLDFITMSVEAGLNFAGAMEQARQKGPPGPLKNEFAIVLRDLRSGLTRERALRRMGERLAIPAVTSFINAVIQSEKMGASMANTLRIQAEQRRNERFQYAEKKAMEAPVKLVGPLVLFIFPTTFIVLAFPVVMKFLHEGIF